MSEDDYLCVVLCWSAHVLWRGGVLKKSTAKEAQIYDFILILQIKPSLFQSSLDWVVESFVSNLIFWRCFEALEDWTAGKSETSGLDQSHTDGKLKGAYVGFLSLDHLLRPVAMVTTFCHSVHVSNCKLLIYIQWRHDCIHALYSRQD